MIKFPTLNPYMALAGAALIASISGGFYYQSARIHHFHTMYDCVESGKDCPKGTENIPALKATIDSMTTAQNNQTNKSEQAVIKVVQGPKEVQTIIREIQGAPGKPCTPPSYPDEVKNAF